MFSSDINKLIATSIMGMMGFISSNFWLALFLQEVKHYDALNVAVRILPQVIARIIWNILAANVLHWVNNTAIMAGGAASYVVANLLLALQGTDSSYWAFIFPSLIINVLGADFQFNVTNVRHPYPVAFLVTDHLDVRHASASIAPASSCRWHLQHADQAGVDHRAWNIYGCIQLRGEDPNGPG